MDIKKKNWTNKLLENKETKKRLLYGFYMAIFFFLFFIIAALIDSKQGISNSLVFHISQKAQTIPLLILFLISIFFIFLGNKEFLKIVSSSNSKKIYLNTLSFLSAISLIITIFPYFFYFLNSDKFLNNDEWYFLLAGLIYYLFINSFVLWLFKCKYNLLIILLIQLLIYFVAAMTIIIIFFYSWIPILFIFFIIWSTDIGAWLIGILFGKHIIAKKISPKKTYEGLIGGVLAALGATWILFFIIHYIDVNNSISFPWNNAFPTNANYTWTYCVEFCFVVIGLSLIGQFGDFVFSFFKRKAKIKDYSNIFGPHGGILDRFDAFIFASSVFYLVFLILAIINL